MQGRLFVVERKLFQKMVALLRELAFDVGTEQSQKTLSIGFKNNIVTLDTVY